MSTVQNQDELKARRAIAQKYRLKDQAAKVEAAEQAGAATKANHTNQVWCSPPSRDMRGALLYAYITLGKRPARKA